MEVEFSFKLELVQVKDNCVDPFKISKKTDNIFEYSIDKIEFGVSYIAIHKKIRKNWIK